MLVSDITDYLETIAPRHLQESYDNAGLITGKKNWQVSGVLICLDTTPAIISEAVDRGCNMIVAHHPIVFHGLKKIIKTLIGFWREKFKAKMKTGFL